ncbi:hypothetical protein [Flavobacterium ginsenosidimutans]|uniref:hypothetical protein n=1 Tax=Flavobacterium ginsenosidimutans TaxID=687844 RepID=UPI003D96F600
MDQNLLKRCIVKMKSILDDYISEQYRILKAKENQEGLEDLDKIKRIYDDLPIETWQEFTKSIRWSFKGISAEQALSNCIDNIKGAISSLSFPLLKEQHDTVFDKLRGIVSDKSMAIDPEERKLSGSLLTQAILDFGSGTDKSYNKDYEIWKGVNEIPDFRVGEFYQILYAAKHCRRNKYLVEHSQKWKMLLWHYYNDVKMPAGQKRDLIYELVWLTLRPTAKKIPENSLNGLESLIKEYFNDFEHFRTDQNAEDLLNMLTVIDSSAKFGLIEIEEELINGWYQRFESYLAELKIEFKNRKHDLVRILEIDSFLILNKNGLGYGEKQENLEKIKMNFDEIIEFLPEAPRFSVSQLGERVSAVLQMYFDFNEVDDEVRILEDFEQALEPFVLSRDRDKDTAKSYVMKGNDFLNSVNPKGILRALSYFHKAKNLYFNDDYAEGYILGLLNISQFYSSMGMNIAAKHYALAAIRYAKNAADTALYKRISDGYGMLFHYEFTQGAWISALQTFEMAVYFRNEFDPRGFDPEVDEMLKKKLLSVCLILAIAPLISPQLSYFIAEEKKRMGSLYTDSLYESTEYITSKAKDRDAISEIIGKRIQSPPINDLGEFRTLSWKIFGSIWKVTFKNDFKSNSIAEEFCSLVQVLLVDIAVNDLDFHLLKQEINVEIEISDIVSPPVQFLKNGKCLWKVHLAMIDSNDPEIVRRHYAYIATVLHLMLSELSLLPEQRLNEAFKLLMSKDLVGKTFVLSAYQMMYRNEFSKDQFDDSKRNMFKSENFGLKHFQPKALDWNSDLSRLYDKDQSIQNIKRRYSNDLRRIAFTFNRIKETGEFIGRVNELREKGWLDWQILMALKNTIINYKGNKEMSFLNKENLSIEERSRHFSKVIERIRKEGETAANFIDIPLDEILGDNLEMHLNDSAMSVLKSFGLENRSRFNNPAAILELLDAKFAYSEDDAIDESPFKF